MIGRVIVKYSLIVEGVLDYKRYVCTDLATILDEQISFFSHRLIVRPPKSSLDEMSQG